MKKFFIFPALIFSIFIYSISNAAIFDGNTGVTYNDSTGGLSWDESTAALSVYCWFKLSAPTGSQFTENMVILADRKSGDIESNISYLIQYNSSNGSIEFMARGGDGFVTITLVERPYIDRWYHVAVERTGDIFYPYVDGQEKPSVSSVIGDSSNTDGISIGCWGNQKYFRGEILEVCIFQKSIGYMVEQLRFLDLLEEYHSFLGVVGYYKLNDKERDSRFKNYASNPPTETENGVKTGTGTISIVEADNAVEQSLFDSYKNRGEDAIVPLSGSFTWQDTPLSRATFGIPFEFTISYSSAIAPTENVSEAMKPTTLSAGWRHNFEMRIIPTQSSTERKILMPDGAIETWLRENDNYKTQHKEYRGKLELLTNDDYMWTSPDDIKYYFYDPTYVFLPWEEQKKGRLYKIEDQNGNSINIDWNGFAGIINNITDCAGGEYLFEYNDQNFLSKISLNDWEINFEYQDSHLTAIWKVSPEGYNQVETRKTFEYNEDGLLFKLFEPNATVPAREVTYDNFGRVVKLKDALENVTTTAYDKPLPRQITRTDPNGNKWIETFDRKHRLLQRADPLGNTTSFTYDEFGNQITDTDARGFTSHHTYDSRANRTSTTDALGNTSKWEYHTDFNKVVKATDPLGWITDYDYDESGNLVRQYDSIGDIASFTYLPNGQIQTSKGGNGNTTSYTYSPEGFLSGVTDPIGAESSYQYNDLGWKISTTNPLNQTVTYKFDINGNVINEIDALGRSTSKVFDEKGNLVEKIDAKGNKTEFYYDAANQLISKKNAIGGETKYEYSPLGMVTKVTDALNNEVNNTYDKSGRLINIKDAGNFNIDIEYDANGNEISRTDQLGKKWTKKYDALNSVVEESDPLGNTVRSEYDKLRRVSKKYSPNGYSSVNEYDGRGRLIKWIDPEGYEWVYTYDGNVNIIDIEDAKGGHYVMQYGSRNERTYERNQDSDTFLYQYDELKRLKTITKPDNVAITYDYDAGSRLIQKTYSTGRTDVFEYDDNDNVIMSSRTKDAITISSSFAYDELNRITTSTDNHYFSVGYAYDLLGRVISTTYPGSRVLTSEYNELGRLTRQVDWNGRETQYVYDAIGRLISKTYPNGVVQKNTIDEPGRMTALSYEITSGDPFLAYTYAYDRNSNITDAQSTGSATVVVPQEFDETFEHTPASKMISKEDAVDPNYSFTYNYDDNGNLITAASPSKTYNLQYDEDSRTTVIQLQQGENSYNIQNIYDFAGKRIARIKDGVETRFILDGTERYEKVIAEADSSNNITKCFVYGGGVLNYVVEDLE